MKIVYVTDFYSENMGYSENCLSKAMASLGHDVHVIASDLQIYGNMANYDKTYGQFLGKNIQQCGTKQVDGYWLHRFPHKLYFGYVNISGILSKIGKLKPDIVQVTSCISISAFKLALACTYYKYKLFTECHQHQSIIKQYLKQGCLFNPKKLFYFVTRTVPGRIISLSTEKCFPIAPDCMEVARKYYGVEDKKIQISSLGTDTELFYPVIDATSRIERLEIRQQLKINDSDIVCVYSGRFSKDKNPLLLARAVEALRRHGFPYQAVFIGDGAQKDEIMNCQGSTIVPFVHYVDLPKYYRAADIGVWPTQESLSMLDAASCGIPIVVSDQIGEAKRVEGNGIMYREGELEELVVALKDLYSSAQRSRLGGAGRIKMVKEYSWLCVAAELLKEYEFSLGK